MHTKNNNQWMNVTVLRSYFDAFQGLMWEALHAIGEAILVLKVLPYLDSTYAILLMPLVAIIPICLQVRAKYLSVKDNSKKQYQQSEQYRRKIKLAMAALALVRRLGL